MVPPWYRIKNLHFFNPHLLCADPHSNHRHIQRVIPTLIKGSLISDDSLGRKTIYAPTASGAFTATATAASPANLAAEAATVAAEEALDAADAAVEALATEVATLMAALKAQITTLANTVAKVAKKVKA